jgi:Ca2+-binding EF-hand superfamily protein
MDRHELAKLLADVGLEMGHAELEMMLNRLDPDHDGYVGLNELKAVLAHTTAAEEAYYTIGPVPKLKPGSDTLKIETSGKKKGLFKDNAKDATGHEVMDWSKVKKAR